MNDSPGPPNLVLIIMDGARAASIAGHGGSRTARTPALDRLRSEGTFFSHAVAPGNWTLPSHLSLFTATLPWTHRLRTFRRGTSPLPTIASWLSARRYDTALFTEEVHLIAGYGLEDGYRHRECPVPAQSDEERTITNRVFGHAGWLYSKQVRRLMAALPPTALPLTWPNHRAEIAFKRLVSSGSLLDGFERWLTSRDRSHPFHAFFNFVDPHEPYEVGSGADRLGILASRYAGVPRFYLLTVPELREMVPWREVESRYLACLEDVDRKVARVRADLEAAGELDRTLFIVTSDHGQSFGEGGNVYHGCGATDSVLRVPLVVRPPQGTDLPKAVDRWVSICDVPSWLKASALGSAPFDKDGFPLVPFPVLALAPEPVLAEGGPASDPNLSLRGIGMDHRWNHRLAAAYRGSEKYVLDLFAGDLRTWPAGSNPDRDPPDHLASKEAKELLPILFGIREPRQLLDESDQGTATTRRPLDDRRMRSWGYD